MAAFAYTALDAPGKEHHGVLEADNERGVRQQLRDRGMMPLSVDAVVARKDTDRTARVQLGLGRPNISAADLALVTRQMATLANSGLPMEESLLAVSRQTEKSAVRNIIMAVRSKVIEGHALATGMGEYPRVFPDLYRATVEAGEQSGHLGPVLERLADYTESRQQLRQKIQVALLYPGVLTFMAIAVVAFLLAVVVPEVVKVFDGMGQQLPPLTRSLISSSGFLRDHGVILALFLFAAFSLFQYALRFDSFKHRWHRLLLALPLVSKLVRGMNAARFSRTFSILMGSGVAVLEALSIAGKVIANLPMRQAVEEASVRVREGSGIAASLEACGFFPPMTIHLIAAGEASGNLETMLERAAISQEKEAESLIATMLGLFEPVLILVMGLVVLLIVLAVLLPIFDLNQLVS